MTQPTARQAIDTARDVHPAFSHDSTPDAVALRRLALYQQELLAKIVEARLDAVHEEQTIALPLTDFDAGVLLNPYLRVHGGSVTYTDSTVRRPQPLRFVEYPLRLDEIVTDDEPKVYLAAGRLMLLGTVESWQNIASITVDLFPRGPDTLKLNETLVLPGSPLRACAADLAAFMAVRAGVTVTDPQPAQTGYLDEVTERRRAHVGTVRETW